MLIPDDKLLEIKDAASIAEVVGQYVKLVQKGRNLLGLCPFHSETKPSFTVSPDKGIFYCFGCQAGGNVISFMMQYHRLSFAEAAQELARRYGIPITFKDLGPEGAQRAKKRQTLQEIVTQAASFFAATLKAPEGKAGRDYLEKRKMTPEVIRDFHLGFAPDEWDGLKRHLTNRGLSLELAQDAGLLVAKAQGGYYDRFRSRVIFPIHDRHGKVVAFGGRIVGEGEPKYLNSPESPLYTKGRHLYGVPQAQEALRKTETALVVEGYLDLLALRVHGVANVVATLGTALTREQVRLLKNLAPKAVMVYDGDAAGSRAMRRAFPLFAQEGLPVRVLPLPAGMDPDTYVFAHGPELFDSPWEAAQPWFAYLLDELVKEHGLDIEGRVRISEELRPYFQAVADPVEQALWLKVAAERLEVDEAALRRSLTSLSPITKSRLSPVKLDVNLEKRLLKWVLNHPGAAPVEELEDWALDLEDQELQEIMALIVRSYREHGVLDHGLLIQQVEAEPLRQQICALTLGEEELGGPSPECMAAHWRRDFRMRRLKKAQQDLKARVDQAVRSPDNEDLMALLAQQQEIARQLEALKQVSTTKGEDG
ncbi:MAG: DNA primase [Deltaproteobacteria bacterium]|nr:DNA primase [Deltaproteobacteria bacterium]